MIELIAVGSTFTELDTLCSTFTTMCNKSATGLICSRFMARESDLIRIWLKWAELELIRTKNKQTNNSSNKNSEMSRVRVQPLIVIWLRVESPWVISEKSNARYNI